MKTSAALTQEIQLLEKAIAHFFTTLIPLDQLDSLLPEDKSTLLTVHTLVHTALIQIYRPLASDDPVFFEKCSNAARACVSVVKYINDQDYDFLEPIIGVCFMQLIIITHRSPSCLALLVLCGGHPYNGT
jgi:hypothetical protein